MLLVASATVVGPPPVAGDQPDVVGQHLVPVDRPERLRHATSRRATGNPAQSNLGFFPLLPDPDPGHPRGHPLRVLGVGPRHHLRARPGRRRGRVVDAPGRLRPDRRRPGHGPGVLLPRRPGAELRLHRGGHHPASWPAPCWPCAATGGWLAGLCAAVATTADPVAGGGHRALRGGRRASPSATAGEWRSLWAPVLAPLGIASFFVYLWAHAGSPFEYFRAQRAGWQGGTYFDGIPGRLLPPVHPLVRRPGLRRQGRVGRGGAWCSW